MIQIAELRVWKDPDNPLTVRLHGWAQDEDGNQIPVDWDAPVYLTDVVLDQARKMGAVA